MKALSLKVSTLFAAAALSALLGLTAGADATKMRSGGAAMTAAMGACNEAEDSKYYSFEKHTACCSVSVGICVICPKPGYVGMMCDVVNHTRDAVPEGMGPKAGSSIRGKSQ